MKAWVDPNRCQGHTLCSMVAPDFFELSDIDGHASARSEMVPSDQAELVREAEGTCPEQAIVVSE